AINMVESGAAEVSEEGMLEALMFGHEEIKKLVAFQEEIQAAVGKEKMEVLLLEVDADVEEEVQAAYKEKMVNAIQIFDKQERAEQTEAVKKEAIAFFAAKYADHDEAARINKEVKKIVE